jgi:hypothetical protein
LESIKKVITFALSSKPIDIYQMEKTKLVHAYMVRAIHTSWNEDMLGSVDLTTGLVSSMGLWYKKTLRKIEGKRYGWTCDWRTTEGHTKVYDAGKTLVTNVLTESHRDKNGNVVIEVVGILIKDNVIEPVIVVMRP